MPGIQTRVFNLRFIRLHNVVSRGLRVLQVWFGKLQAGSHVPFTIQTWLVECCRKSCPFRRLSSLHRAMVSVRVTIGFFGQLPTLTHRLVGWPVLDAFHLYMMEATVHTGILNTASIPFTTSMPRYNPHPQGEGLQTTLWSVVKVSSSWKRSGDILRREDERRYLETIQNACVWERDR